MLHFWVSWQTFISSAKNYLKQNEAIQVLCGLSLLDVLTAEDFIWLLTSLTHYIMLQKPDEKDNLAVLC